ncbi:MAG TPA: TonB family protein [Gemmatimonadaceae bacterium]|nr:TonB family protein [Gemmatimonadaceae bacterium]
MTIATSTRRSLIALSLLFPAAFALPAQSARPRAASPVVPLRTHWYSTFAVGLIMPDALTAAKVEATSDGWVVVTPLSFGEDLRERYPDRRMYLTPAEVLRWAGAMRALLARQLDSVTSADTAALRAPLLGRGGASIDAARLGGPPGGMRRNFEMRICGSYFISHNVADSTLLRIAELLARAAGRASSARATPRPPTLERPYLASEAGCVAKPAIENRAPRYPTLAAGAARPTRDVGLRFVVDTTGRVEPGSIAVLPDTPTRFATAARAAVEQWRYEPATWGNAPIRQVVHLVVAFDPDAKTAAEVMFTSLGNRPEPRVLFDPTPDGWVRVTHGEWERDGHLKGSREWFSPDSMRIWLARIEYQLHADAVEPRIWREGASYTAPGMGYQQGRTFLASLYPMVRVARDSVSPPDSVQYLRVALFSCGAPFYFGERIDSAVLARVRSATDAAVRARSRPARIGRRVYDGNEVACRAAIRRAELNDPRFPSAQLHRVGPYPPSMREARARAEVMTSFVVDTTGHVERGSLVVLPGADLRAVAAIRAHIRDYDFTPASRAGVRVRQRVVRTWTFLPPLVCESEEQGLECPRRYGPNLR